MKPVPEPPDLDIGNFRNTFDMIGGVANLVRDRRVNPVEEPGEDPRQRPAQKDERDR